ncbi:hypothetical protein C2U68_03245 [Methylomonas koyamae]|nr:hypothetical protein C2U68_03245 [Methylomonas koyamae]
MASADSYLHLIGGEVLLILWIVTRLQDDPARRRRLAATCLLILGAMTAHLVSHVLPERLANFIYSSHHQYHFLKQRG